MAKILVSGLINIETTLQIERFPLEYNPVNSPFFGINSTVSGVGYNISKALKVLGNEVKFFSMIGDDPGGKLALTALRKDQIGSQYISRQMHETPQSVILYDQNGKRQVHIDLKDIQKQDLPIESFDQAAKDCEGLALCNINFSRPLLERTISQNKLIATDVHTVSDLEDDYDQDFMEAANILFMSDENLPLPPEEWAERTLQRYNPDILVIGMGSFGALLGLGKNMMVRHFPAATTRPVVNTIGAGDALFSAFLHSYLRSGNPITSLRKAILFASWKIGEKSAEDGFLNETELNKLSHK